MKNPPILVTLETSYKNISLNERFIYQWTHENKVCGHYKSAIIHLGYVAQYTFRKSLKTNFIL